MLPITRATMQCFCRTCLQELPPSTSSQQQDAALRDLQYDENLRKTLHLATGHAVTIEDDYPKQLCQNCYNKTQAFNEFRETAFCCAVAIRELLMEDFAEIRLNNLQYFCCTCLNRLQSLDNGVIQIDDIDIKRWMAEYDKLKADSREIQWPQRICGSCCEQLHSFMEYQLMAKQSLIYMEKLLGGQKSEDVPSEHFGAVQYDTNTELDSSKYTDTESQLQVQTNHSSDTLNNCGETLQHLKIGHISQIENGQSSNLGQFNRQLDDGVFMLTDAYMNPHEEKTNIGVLPFIHNDAKGGIMRTSTTPSNFFISTTDMYREENSNNSICKKSKGPANFALNKIIRYKKATVKYKTEKRNSTKAFEIFSDSMINENNSETLICNENDSKKCSTASEATTIKDDNKDCRCSRFLPSLPVLGDGRDSLNVGKIAMIDIHKPKQANHKLGLVHQRLRLYKCNRCAKRFISRKTCNMHEMSHKNRWQCQYKGRAKRFQKSRELCIHKEKHTTNIELQCTICKYANSNPEELQQHMTSYHLKCETCGKLFITEAHLHEHMSSVHLRPKKYRCSHCMETFGYRKNWQRHEAEHVPNNPNQLLCRFMCHTCKCGFNTRKKLKRHTKKHEL